MSTAIAEREASKTALPVCLWLENSNRLVSLWDMLEMYAFGFYEVSISLAALREQARMSELGDGVLGTSKVYAHTREELLECLPKLRAECDALSLISTSELVERLESEVPRRGDKYTYRDLLNDLDVLSFSFSAGLKKRTAFLIGAEKKKYFQRDDLVANVATAFPLCASEIKNAGNCYALEQDAACVFHCMCALETALHVLANEVGETFSGTLDLQNWGTIIPKIESKITALEQQLPKGQHKSEKLKFLSEAAMQFRWFKDAWRNHVMHGRDIYDPGKAFSVFDHVRQFMQALADGGLKE